MLAVSLRVLHWHTHFVNVNFTLDSVCILWLRPKVYPMQNSCQHWCIAFGIINVDTRGGLVLNWRVGLVLGPGEGVDLC